MLLAILLPGLWLIRNKRRGLGILFLLLHLTLIGWIVGAVVAVRTLKRRQRRRMFHGYGGFTKDWGGGMRL